MPVCYSACVQPAYTQCSEKVYFWSENQETRLPFDRGGTDRLPDPSPGKPGPTPRSASHYTGGYMRRIGSGGVRPAGAASGRALAGNPLLRRFSERLLFPAPDTQHVSGEWHTSVLQAYEYPDGTCPALE